MTQAKQALILKRRIMSINRLMGVNDTLTIFTYLGVIGLALFDEYPLWAAVALGLVAATALTTNIMVWQQRPPRSKTSRPKGMQTWKLALNVLLCLASLLGVYYVLNGN